MGRSKHRPDTCFISSQFMDSQGVSTHEVADRLGSGGTIGVQVVRASQGCGFREPWILACGSVGVRLLSLLGCPFSDPPNKSEKLWVG